MVLLLFYPFVTLDFRYMGYKKPPVFGDVYTFVTYVTLLLYYKYNNNNIIYSNSSNRNTGTGIAREILRVLRGKVFSRFFG